MDLLKDRLKTARKARRLTQAKVAEHFSIDRVSVTQWELGLTRPDPDRFKGIAELYDVPLEWLVTGEGSGPTFLQTVFSGDTARQEAQEIAAIIEDLDPADRAYIRGRIDELVSSRSRKP